MDVVKFVDYDDHSFLLDSHNLRLLWNIGNNVASGILQIPFRVKDFLIGYDSYPTDGDGRLSENLVIICQDFRNDFWIVLIRESINDPNNVSGAKLHDMEGYSLTQPPLRNFSMKGAL